MAGRGGGGRNWEGVGPSQEPEENDRAVISKILSISNKNKDEHITYRIDLIKSFAILSIKAIIFLDFFVSYITYNLLYNV
jgi:hypothetical protein